MTPYMNGGTHTGILLVDWVTVWWFYWANMSDHALFPFKSQWSVFPLMHSFILWEAEDG